MSYKINLEALSGVYALPSAVVDKHIKLSGAIQLKVLLLGLKNPANIDEGEIAEILSVSQADVIDALNYWTDLSVLDTVREADVEVKAKPQKSDKPTKKVIVAEAIKPTRQEVAKRGEESPEVANLLREAQMRLARPLTPNEASTLVWLYDDEGIDSSVLLLLISFARSEGKANIGFIEKTAVKWLNEGVKDVNDAEQKIRHAYEMRSAWGIVEKALGIPHRMPSETERKLAYKWICEYGYTTDMLKKAYDICVDATSSFSIPYIKKILDEWHKKGIRGTRDLIKYLSKVAEEKEKGKKKEEPDSKVTFNVDLFNKSLNDLPE